MLDAAAQRMRAGGFAGVTVGTVMEAAGLTHGAFYAHFRDRGDLLLEAAARALRNARATLERRVRKRGGPAIAAFVDAYLSPQHRDRTADGCAVAALARDVSLGDAALQKLFAAEYESYVGWVAEMLGEAPEPRAKAVTTLCTLVGALTLARAMGTSRASGEVLELARTALRADLAIA
jgi:TetR/AcrR family transcriptional repressor of nem operon